MYACSFSFSLIWTSCMHNMTLSLILTRLYWLRDYVEQKPWKVQKFKDMFFKYIYCKITYLSSVLRRYPKSWVAVEKCICLKNTSLIGQISFNGQRCDLQIHDCFLNDRQSRVRDRFISYSKYSRRGTLFIQKKVGSALTETENWDLLVDCTSRDGRQMLDVFFRCSPIW
jgi:hypothetical protein